MISWEESSCRNFGVDGTLLPGMGLCGGRCKKLGQRTNGERLETEGTWTGSRAEKLEKAVAVDFEKHPARKDGTRSRAVWTNVCGRLAFPGARNPRNVKHFARKEFQRFSSDFPEIFPELSSRTPAKTPETTTAFPSFLIKL